MNTTNVSPLRRHLSLALLASVLFTSAPNLAQALSGWSSSFSGGVSRAQAANQPLLVVIAKDGCPACESLESNLGRTNSSLNSAVRVRVESERDPALAARFAAGGTPTILVFTKSNGYSAPVYSYTGVMSTGEIRQLGRSLDSLAGK